MARFKADHIRLAEISQRMHQLVIDLAALDAFAGTKPQDQHPRFAFGINYEGKLEFEYSYYRTRDIHCKGTFTTMLNETEEEFCGRIFRKLTELGEQAKKKEKK